MDIKKKKRKRLTAKSVGLLPAAKSSCTGTAAAPGRMRTCEDVSRFKCYNPGCSSRFVQSAAGSKYFRAHLVTSPLCQSFWKMHQSASNVEGNGLELDVSMRHCSKCGRNYKSEEDHLMDSPSCGRHFDKVNSVVFGMEIAMPIEGGGEEASIGVSCTVSGTGTAEESTGLCSSSNRLERKKGKEAAASENMEMIKLGDVSVEGEDEIIARSDVETKGITSSTESPLFEANDDAFVFDEAESVDSDKETEENSYEDDEFSNAANVYQDGGGSSSQNDFADLMWREGVTIVENGPGKKGDYVRGDPPELGCIIHYPVNLVLQRSARLNERQRFSFELYKSLQGSSCLGTYNTVKDIVSKKAPDLFGDGRDIPSREVFLKEMADMFPTESPTEVVVTMEGYAKSIRDAKGVSTARKKNSFQGMEKTERVKMYTWCMRSQMQASLLNVRTMGNVKNLVVNQDDDPKSDRLWQPYEPVPGDDEILAGKWFQNTVKEDALDPRTNFYVPPYFYTDGTGTDVNQKYPVEPLIWCPTILKRSLREDFRNWFPLAYLADTDRSSAAMRQLLRSRKSGKGLSSRNCHRMMTHGLAGFRELQESGRSGKNPMWVRMGDYVKFCNVLSPLYGTAGDGKSGDTIAGRFAGHNTRRMCRLCNATYSDCGNPAHRCKMMYMRDINILFKLATDMNSTKEERQKYLDELQNLSMHVVDNAFFGLDYGANKHGILLGTPSDMMHLYELGILCYVLALFVNSMTASVRMKVDLAVEELFKSWRSSKKKDFLRMNFVRGCTSISLLTAAEWPGLAFCYLIVLLTENGKKITTECFVERKTVLPPATVSEIKKTKFELMTVRPKVLEKFTEAELDAILRNERSAVLGAQESDVDDDACEADDEDGDSKKQGHDKEEVLLVEGNEDGTDEDEFVREIFEESSSAANDHSKKKGTKNKKAVPLNCTRLQFVDLLLTLLSFHAWYKSDFPTSMMETEEEMTEVLKKIRMMMLKITTYCPREEGNGWNLQKFHELTHVVIFIYYFGSCKNFDAGSGERSLKVFVKQLAKVAQKRGNVFLGQLCRRVWEMTLMNKVEDNEMMWNELVPVDDDCRSTDERTCGNNDSVHAAAGKKTPNQSRDVEGHVKYRIWYDKGIRKTTARWENKKTLTSIHPVVLNYFDKFFREKIHLDESQNLPVIHCWTEYAVVSSSNKEKEDEETTTRLRCHENYRHEGQWYDYCFVKYHDDSSSSGFIEFPAKVLCFYKFGPVGETFCLVHSCDYMENIVPNEQHKKRRTNHSKLRRKEYWSNALCERWVLESKKVVYQVQQRRGRPIVQYVPVINSIKASAIQDCALVFEENPGMKESTPEKQHCWVVHDRLTEWPKHFLELEFLCS